MRIGICDGRLRDGKLVLDVQDLYIGSEIMSFYLDGKKYFNDFIVTAVKNGMVQKAFKTPSGEGWYVVMDINYLAALYHE